ncbi:MAG: type II secretion system GspH family protein [Atopostipes suicloacalis]|nr:type II secretion system GspH family protein [Atopostipes suicloacalis]
MKGKEDGFTLVETLISLLIVSFLILLPVLSIKDTLQSIEVDLFFRELTSNITLMQNHAILMGESTSIDFVPSKKLIRFSVHDGKNTESSPLNREMNLDDSICRYYGNASQKVYFKANTGNISVVYNRWKIKFKTVNNLYELVFRLGSGRFEIRKK